MTPRRLAANRANAQHSTGPRSLEGKRRSRLNALRCGRRSRTYEWLVQALSLSGYGRVRETAAAILNPEELQHPFYAREIEKWQRFWEFCARQSPQFKMFIREMRRRGKKSGRTKPESRLKSRALKNEAIRLMKTKEL